MFSHWENLAGSFDLERFLNAITYIRPTVFPRFNPRGPEEGLEVYVP